jgi:hypothetical protein
MNAKEAAARLEDELAILRSRRPWWKRLARHTVACGSWIPVLFGHAKLKKSALFTRVALVTQANFRRAAIARLVRLPSG